MYVKYIEHIYLCIIVLHAILYHICVYIYIEREREREKDRERKGGEESEKES